MTEPASPIIAATRGSPLALAQTRQVLADCRQAFPDQPFAFQVIKTTGDKLQQVSLNRPDPAAGKGLFTKELEVALLEGGADLAVHSLKDLPTDLPAGLELGAVPLRADPRDVLLYRSHAGADSAVRMAESAGSAPRVTARGLDPGLTLDDFPAGATIATSSTRRRAQLLALRPDLRVVEIRGNVGTRLRKLLENPDWDGTILAAAGLARLGYRIGEDGSLAARNPVTAAEETDAAWEVRHEFHASVLPIEEMLPCVGQAALGIEIRAGDDRLEAICARLTHAISQRCVTAERAFLRAMGGGCQSPVAAYAELVDGRLRLRAVSFQQGPARAAELTGALDDPAGLGEAMAGALR